MARGKQREDVRSQRSHKMLVDLLIAVKPLQSFANLGGLRSAPLSQGERAQPASMGFSSPNWKWGDGSGEAAVEVVRVRRMLATQEDRERFVKAMDEDRADLLDAKVALALLCEKLDPMDDLEGMKSWKRLLNQLNNMEFETDIPDDQLIDGNVRLKAACNIRIPNSILQKTLLKKMKLAYEALNFVEGGI